MVVNSPLTRLERFTLTCSITLVSLSFACFLYAGITYMLHEQVLASNADDGSITVEVATNTTSILKPPTPKATLTTAPIPSTPVRLQIPSLKIDTTIEELGLKADGSMQAPTKPDDVGWFKPGYPPGMNGNAVIAGHLTGTTGKPAIFFNLSKLVAGDEIKVIDDKGNTQRFVVTRTEAYPYDSAPLTDIFGSFPRPRLNLITCDGSYVHKKGTYNERLVVYSELAL